MAIYILPENDLGVFTDLIVFDATFNEMHENISTPTEFPIEDGSVVSDHIHHSQPTVSCEVFVTNTPIGPRHLDTNGSLRPLPLDLPIPFEPQKVFPGIAIATPGAGVRTAIAGLEGRLTPPVAVATTYQFDPFDAVSEMHLKLLGLRDTSANLRLVSGLTEYKNMVLIQVSSPRSNQDGDGARFLLAFKRIRKVVAGIVAAPEIPLEPNGQPAKVRGGTGSKVAESDEEARKAQRSILLGLVLGRN